MSRGPGALQRRVCEVLYYVDGAAEGEGLSPRELRRRLGEPDRSNLHRAVRSLKKREIVEEFVSGEDCGELRLRLTFWAYTAHVSTRELDPLRRRKSMRRRIQERWIALQKAREEKRREREAEAARAPRWFRYEHRFVRRRDRGEVQTRILSVLWYYSDPPEAGLPVTVVKAITGGDRSNARRAIRTLLLRKDLEESEDGRRVRLHPFLAYWYPLYPPAPLEAEDDERARAIIRAHEDADPPRRP